MRPMIAIVWCLAACGGGGDGSFDAALDVDATIDTGSDTDAAPDAASACQTQPAITLVPAGGAGEIVPAGDTGSTLGIFDPSYVYPAGAPGGAMAYSSVPDQHSVRTRVALSGDQGASWTFVAQANAPVATTLTSSSTSDCPTGSCTGFLIDETPSLVIDPLEPDAARRWKLFTHRYLAEADTTLHYQYGTITLYTAPAPEGPWSAAQPLIGWNSAAPHSSTGTATNVSTIPAMADCVALSEPNALVRGGTIDLALGCVYLSGGGPRIRVVLMRSTDHAATFDHVTTLLTPNDAACVGGASRSRYNAAQLFVSGGTEYLIASGAGGDGFYAGCDVFAIDDPVAGAIRRDGSGNAMALRRLEVAGRFNGACTAAEGIPGGYAISVLHVDAPPRIFRIARAGVAAP